MRVSMNRRRISSPSIRVGQRPQPRRSVPRLVWLLLAGLVVVLAIGATVLLWPRDNTEIAGRFVPEETLALVQLVHLNDLTDHFAESALGRLLAAETVREVVRELNADPALAAEYERTAATMAEVARNPVFRAVFGGNAVLALLPVDAEAFARQPAHALRDSLVVLGRSPGAGAADLFARLAAGREVGREAFNGLDLLRLPLDPVTTLYALSEDDTLLLGLSPQAIFVCVETARSGKPSLVQGPGFAGAQRFWTPVSGKRFQARNYVDIRRMAALLAASPEREWREVALLLSDMAASYGQLRRTRQGLESISRTNLGPGPFQPPLQAMIEASATAKNRSLHLLQQESLIYLWSATCLPEILVQNLFADAAVRTEVETWVKKTLGSSPAEAGQALGPGWGLVLEDLVNTGLFPAPRMTLFVDVRDKTMAGAFSDRLRSAMAATGSAVIEQEEVGGRTITTWPLLPHELAQPSLLFTEQLASLSTSRQAARALARSAGDDQARPAGAVSDAVQSGIAEAIREANANVLVLHPQRMADRAGMMANWLGSLLVQTKGISLARFNQELVRFLQSFELVVLVQDLERDHTRSRLWIETASDLQSK